MATMGQPPNLEVQRISKLLFFSLKLFGCSVDVASGINGTRVQGYPGEGRSIEREWRGGKKRVSRKGLFRG